MTDRHADITDHGYGDSDGLVKAQTAPAETEGCEDDDGDVEEHERYDITRRLLAERVAVKTYGDDCVGVDATLSRANPSL